MPYTAEISRRNPSAILFVIDQSGSMAERWNEQITKAQALADAVNRLLQETIIKCSKEDGVRHYFDVGVLGYGGFTVRDALSFIPGGVLKPVSELERHPLRLEERRKAIPDGAGGIIEQTVRFPIWFEPVADGETPMCAALQRAAETIADWADAHPSAFPPVVLHVTDGEPTDGDPELIAALIQQLETHDGHVLLFNLHIAAGAGQSVLFPASEAAVPPTQEARRLFRMSSPVPPFILEAARAQGFEVSEGARGYGYRVDLVEAIKFLNIGTQAINLAR
jgi:uncharacterized protein YegL